MEQTQLQQLVEDISISFFNRRFKHVARFNPRLRTTGGRYLLESHDIEINPKQLDVNGYDELVGIIKHELCHYHLHLMKKGYKHQDRDFKQLLETVGGTRYCSMIPGQRRKEAIKYVYICQSCQHRYPRKRKVNTRRFVCGKCSGKLILK